MAVTAVAAVLGWCWFWAVLVGAIARHRAHQLVPALLYGAFLGPMALLLVREGRQAPHSTYGHARALVTGSTGPPPEADTFL